MKLKNYLFYSTLLTFCIISENYGQSQSTNIFLGFQTGLNNTGLHNSGFGNSALLNNSNHGNSAFGIDALRDNNGAYNCAFGNEALYSNKEGNYNASFGKRSLEHNVSGSANVAFGYRALGDNNTSGSSNVAIGYASLLRSNGSGNTALGNYAGFGLESGNSNIFIGNYSSYNNLNGSNNVFIGKVNVENQPSTSQLVGNDSHRSIIIADGAGNQRLLINSAGNVGIGLGNNIKPSNRLDINGGVVIGKGYMPSLSSDSSQGVIAPANGLLVQGNIGVGTTSPKSKLEITQGTNGKSGLRFTNLTSNFVPEANQVSDKFLTVNATGDVVLQKTSTSALTGTLTTNNNTITSNVNGNISNASIINSITNTINSNNQLVTTINGVTSTPITFPTFTDTDAQTLSLVGNTLSISNGNSVVLPSFDEIDGSTTNELQTLSQSGNTITLSNGGGSFQLPTLTDTDAQTLSLVGNTLSISNGNSVTIPLPVFAGGNVTITGNGTTATPYTLNAVDTSLYANNGSINQSTTTGANRVVNMNSRNIWFNTATSSTNGKIYIGSTATYPSSTGDYKLFVEGGILTEKVKVALRSTANWADYVFAADYKLMPLAEVENFISKNNHLPGIKSATELAENGLDIAEMQAKHMEKIEELTLYAIEQDKKIKEQNQLISKFSTELEELKNQVKALIEKTK